MARKLVTYYKTTTRKPKPAVIVGDVSVNGGRVLRVRHHGETYGDATTGILLRTSHSQTNVYVFA
jgi:hypothetical protein